MYVLLSQEHRESKKRLEEIVDELKKELSAAEHQLQKNTMEIKVLAYLYMHAQCKLSSHLVSKYCSMYLPSMEKLVDRRPRCQWSVNWMSTECPLCIDRVWIEVSIQGIDRCSSADALNTHNPIALLPMETCMVELNSYLVPLYLLPIETCMVELFSNSLVPEL